MTIVYALLSITCGAICTVFAWIEFGPLIALAAYAVAGTLVLLLAAALIAARPSVSGMLSHKRLNTGGNSAAG